MESKQCTQCKRTLLLEQFKTNKRSSQVTKKCIKCFDIGKKSRETNKSQHGKQRRYCKDPHMWRRWCLLSTSKNTEYM